MQAIGKIIKAPRKTPREMPATGKEIKAHGRRCGLRMESYIWQATESYR